MLTGNADRVTKFLVGEDVLCLSAFFVSTVRRIPTRKLFSGQFYPFFFPPFPIFVNV